MSTTEHKALIRRLFDEGWSEPGFPILEQAFAADHFSHAYGVGGPDAIRQIWTTFQSAFPDGRFTLNDLVAEGDRVAFRATFTGTQSGELIGIAPTGKSVSIGLIEICRFRDGQIVEDWTQTDMLGLLQQLGVVPVPGSQAGGTD
jgi:predicted ester cyclase